MTVEDEGQYNEDDTMMEDMEEDANMIDMSALAGLAKQKSRNHDDGLSAKTTQASMSSFASPEKWDANWKPIIDTNLPTTISIREVHINL